MWVLLAALLILAVVALLLGYRRNRAIREKIGRGELNAFPDVRQSDTDCCGQHEMCERDSLLAAVSKKIEYYDDEELDVYRGIPCDGYTPSQVEQFREIFYTMQETDIAGWSRSLQLRGINLPDELKDEVLLVVGERRTQTK